jgi:CBS domain-containing protein
VLVSEVMSAPAVTVRADTSVKAAARVLRDRDVAAAPVVDDAGA